MPLVAVAEYSDRITAAVARLALDAEGIPAVLFDAGVASLGFGPIASARLMVAETEAEHAKRILAALAD